MKRLVKSHFIQAEKPYGVFAYVCEGPFLLAGQLIGNIINIYQDDENDGKVSYEHLPVFRNPDKSYMNDLDHAFVGYNDILESDVCPLGFVGSQVGLKELNLMRRLDYQSGDNSHDPKDVLKYFDATGLQYGMLAGEIAKGNAEGKFKDMNARVYYYHKNDGYRRWDEYYLEVDGGITLFTQLDSGDTCIDIARQMRDWREMGVDYPTIAVEDEYYEHQILELAMQAENMATHMIEHKTDCIEKVFRLRKAVGRGHVTMETIYDAAPIILCRGKENTREADQLIAKAVSEGLLTVDGDCVTFSDSVSNMAEWKFEPKPKK
jgi:ribosomal protein S15P/S13E